MAALAPFVKATPSKVNFLVTSPERKTFAVNEISEIRLAALRVNKSTTPSSNLFSSLVLMVALYAFVRELNPLFGSLR